MSFKLRFLPLTVYLLLSLITRSLVANSGDDTWSAQWIWTNDQGPNNTWVNLRKTVFLSQKPSAAITRIAAENKYWLYINDSIVVREGGQEIRPDLNNTYYDEIDLAPFLTKGNNIISVLVWHKGGPEGYTQRTLPDGGFLFETQLTGTKNSNIVSDKSWKIKTDEAFLRGVFSYKYAVEGNIKFDQTSFGKDINKNIVKKGYYRPAGSSQTFIACANEGETFTLPYLSDVAFGTIESPKRMDADFKWIAYPVSYDARNETQNWQQYDFDDSSWQNAVEKGIPPMGAWNKLFNSKIPLLKDYGLTAYKNQSTLPKTITSNTVVTGNLGINIQGTAYIRIKAPAGVHLRVVLNEFYYQDYITKEGEQEFECLAWQNSSHHTVEYQFTNVNASVEILDLKFRQSGYNTSVIGMFHSNDSIINTLWTKCKNTSSVCMRDYFYDCPNRERGQWWGDVSEQILYSFYLYDSSSVKLMRKSYRELMHTQKADGSLYTTAPGKAFNLPDQNMAAVSMLWNYYLYTGDKTFIQELYPYSKRFVEQCASTANSDEMLIIQNAQGWNLWNWIDWGHNKDVQEGSANTICNALYIVLLENMTNIAETLNQDDDRKYYKALQAKVKKNFNDYFWNGTAYAFHTKDGIMSSTIDDRSGAWAVLAGMVDEDKEASVLNTLETRMDASPYQEMYIELAMLELDPTATLDRARSRFHEMINSWSSTLWEEFPAKGSNNHAWSAGPMHLLSAYYLGVRPLKPAYTEYAFQPLMGDLTEISGIVPSPQGDIKASYSLDTCTLSLTQQINSPENTICIVGIPKSVSGKERKNITVKVGTKTIWKKGLPAKKVAGIKFYEENEQFIKFKVQAGDWIFTSSIKE